MKPTASVDLNICPTHYNDGIGVEMYVFDDAESNAVVIVLIGRQLHGVFAQQL